MKIDVIRIKKVENESSVLAIVDIILNEQLGINNIKIIKSKEGNKKFVFFPTYKKYNKFYEPIVSITNHAIYQQIENAILETYEYEDIHIYGENENFIVDYIDITPQFNSNEEVKSIVTVSLNKSIIIEGISISEFDDCSPKKLNIEFPTYMDNEKKKAVLQFNTNFWNQFSDKMAAFHNIIMNGESGKQLSESNIFRKFVNMHKSNSTEKASTEIINQYKNVLPNDLIELWEKFGFGNYSDGLFKIINPNKYKEAFLKLIKDSPDTKVKERIPFLLTGFGDIYYYRILENDEIDISVYSINTKQISVVEYDFEKFINDYVCSVKNSGKIIPSRLFSDVLKELGKLGEDEIFTIDLIGKPGDTKITIDMVKKINLGEIIIN